MSHDSTPDTSGEVDIDDMLSDTVLFVLRWLRTLSRIEGEEEQEELDEEVQEELDKLVVEEVEETVMDIRLRGGWMSGK